MDYSVIKKISLVVQSITVLLFVFFSFTESLLAKEDTTPSGIPISDLEGMVDHYADDYIGKTTAGAAIIILKDNKVVLSKEYGYADIKNQKEINSRTTVFEWGSISKLFVWTSVMQLVEQGKIDLNADIRTYLPEGFMTKLKYDSPITMLNLMHHNAGFEESPFDLGYSSPDKVKSLEEGLKISEPAQVYKPGEVVAYSNYGTSLAAYIVERVTKQVFYQYVSEHIFTKLEMEDATIHPKLSDNKELLKVKAMGYALKKPSQFTESSWLYVSMYPSGAINGTVVELAKFAAALMPQDGEKSPLFKSNETLKKMLAQSYTPNEHMLGNAHGFWEYEGQKRGLAHGGNTKAFSGNFHIVPEENFAVIVLTNQAGEMDLCYGLTKELVGDGDVSISNEKVPSAKDLDGTYISARRPHHGFLTLFSYLMPLKVKAVNDHEIKLSIFNMSAKYVQTSPYIYKKMNGHIMFDSNKSLFFHVKDGKVELISTSIADYLPVSKSRTVALLTLYMIVAILCTSYLLISPFVLLIIRIKNRRNKRSISLVGKWNGLLILTGTAIVLNNLILMTRMLVNSLRAYSEIVLHIILNYGLTVLCFVFMVFMMVNWRKSMLTKIQKFFYVLSVGMIGFLIFLLINWQFYR